MERGAVAEDLGVMATSEARAASVRSPSGGTVIGNQLRRQ